MNSMRKALLCTVAATVMLNVAREAEAFTVVTLDALGPNLGYGTFIGAFTDPNTNPSGTNSQDIGAVIIATTGPYDWTPAEFNLAGSVEGSVLTPSNADGGDSNPLTGVGWLGTYSGNEGSWIYYGYNDGEDPGGASVDLFVTVKAGNQWFAFLYPLVAPGEQGLFTSNFATYNANNGSNPDLLNLNFTDEDHFQSCNTTRYNTVNPGGQPRVGLFSPNCMPLHGISHATAYWPPPPGDDDTTDMPEPAVIGLFGAGLIGLGLARRRRTRGA